MDRKKIFLLFIILGFFVFFMNKYKKPLPNLKPFSVRKALETRSETKVKTLKTMSGESIDDLTLEIIKPLQDEEKEEYLNSVLEYINSLKSYPIAPNNELLQTFAKFDKKGIATLYHELMKFPDKIEHKKLDERIAIIDFLGLASPNNKLAAQAIKLFSTSPIPSTMTAGVRRAALLDRLESFAYLAKLDSQFAFSFIRSIKDKKIKKLYAENLYIGFQMFGKTEKEADQIMMKQIGIIK